MEISYNFTIFTLFVRAKNLVVAIARLLLLLPGHETNDNLHRYGCLTDFHYSHREEEAIQLDGLNASQIKEIREKSEKFAFQAEVNRMMKLIINSLYKNKEVSVFIMLELLELFVFLSS